MVKNNKGLTLIEVIIAMAIFGMIVSMAYPVLTYAQSSHKSTADEFAVQAEMRVAAESINRFVREASAVFTVKEQDFNPSNLRQGWSYFGVSDNKNEIVHYVWAKDKNTGQYKHMEVPIVHQKENLTYNLYFEKNPDAHRLLGFTLEGYYGERDSKKIVIDSEVEAVNAHQVVDRGNDSEFAVAIAYRTDDRPVPEIDITEGSTGVVAITMVLDVSGSMLWDMHGRNAVEPNRRIDILKEEATKMIESFADMENVYIRLIPFSTSANFPGNSPNPKFLKPSIPSQKNRLLREIDDLTAYGGTNTGDGMRRAYWQLHDFNFNKYPNKDVTNYMILLVDGNPTFSSVVPQTDRVRNRQWPGYIEYWTSRTGVYNGGSYNNLRTFENYNHFRLDNGNVDEDTFLWVNSRRRFWGVDQIQVYSTNNFSNPNYRWNTNNPGWVNQPNRNSVELGFYGNEVIGTGQGDEDNVENNMKYVEYVADQLILGQNIHYPDLDITTFVIGFSARPDEINRAKEIADYCEGSYYEAGDSVELENAFEDIINIILDEQWHIFGP